MCEQAESVCFSLPAWLTDLAAGHDTLLAVEDRMSLAIEASRQNVRRKTGGPFAAGVFESENGRLVALGVNLVTVENLSMLHGEMVALALAQRKLRTWDLGQQGMPALEIVTSTEPCAMCLGGICWSGVTRVVSGATEADARRLGFDEGPKPEDWLLELRQRGIEVNSEVLRSEAVAVLDAYRQEGGVVYNPERSQV
ncbi:MAG TPA: nucleoside deaminase [Thiolapillus brandeum]|uniref:Nucleoside deaminase n=1 Tax=Thiolapillus brandeum TaxID=1076588 RepID=A0A831RX60_9GAMM|nr:nucleoside deaminase [Thiolapillus brandeum]